MPKLLVNWDPKNLEIKSKSVEDQLAPLIMQITTLVNPEKVVRKGRGKSKKAGALVAAVERATANFITKGEEIAEENPPVKEEMLEIVNEIKRAGEVMSLGSRDFALEPCNSQKRTTMVNAARSLLISVTRLLILADMLDIQLFLDGVNAVEASLQRLKTAQPQQLLEELKNFTKTFSNLLTQASRRQQELLDPQRRDDLAAARAVLKRNTTMLISASKAFVQHPDNAAIIASKDKVLRQMCEAVTTIKEVAQGRAPPEGFTVDEGSGKIARNLDALENYKEVRDRRQMEQQVEELVNSIKLISESPSVNDERKKKITDSCTAVKAALQNLLSQSFVSKEHLADMNKRAKDLKRHLRKAVADQVSENVDVASPLEQLVMAAEAGNLQQVEICAENFTEHNENLLQMAEQVCELSNKEEGVKMVRYASSQLSFLYPEVENAAKFLAQYPQSLVAKENMETFRNEYEKQVQILLAAIDDIATIDDILSVLDNNMYEDMDAYIAALQQHNPEKLRSILENVKGRIQRICDVATTEMDNYEPCIYTGNVLEAVRVLREEIITEFEEKTEQVITVFEENRDTEVDDNEFLDTSRLVYEGVREVRRAVLMNRADEDLDPEEVELEETIYTDTLKRTVISEITTTVTDDGDDRSGITVARQAMNNLPEEEKKKILEHVENFESEKLSFDREVAKWDDASNDIIVIAKHMCIIMLHMTDFIREKGPLKSTTDVIAAAKKISEAGTKLDKLTRQIAEQCPESSTKKDLLAYLERVGMYCHQMNIIAKVKTDVQNSDKELILAGVESATSLIENAKNLMNAVVLTVKASYVASTKYSRGNRIANPIVVWKMKAPEKKPLVRLERPKEVRAVVRKASQRQAHNPIKVLSEFQI